VTIAGTLGWQKQAKRLDFYVPEPSTGAPPFAGAAIGAWDTPSKNVCDDLLSGISSDEHPFSSTWKRNIAMPSRLKLTIQK
jgi:hypothetical protein